MWQCRHCHETVEGNLDVCWNCGYSKDGVPPDNPEVFEQMSQERIEEEEGDIVDERSLGTVEGAREQQRRRGGQKWEYCAVIGILKNQDGLEPDPAIWYFTCDGVQVVNIADKEITQGAATIAQLGDEGWEMCGSGSIKDRNSANLNLNAMFFKRRQV